MKSTDLSYIEKPVVTEEIKLQQQYKNGDIRQNTDIVSPASSPRESLLSKPIDQKQVSIDDKGNSSSGINDIIKTLYENISSLDQFWGESIDDLVKQRNDLSNEIKCIKETLGKDICKINQINEKVIGKTTEQKGAFPQLTPEQERKMNAKIVELNTLNEILESRTKEIFDGLR